MGGTFAVATSTVAPKMMEILVFGLGIRRFSDQGWARDWVEPEGCSFGRTWRLCIALLQDHRLFLPVYIHVGVYNFTPIRSLSLTSTCSSLSVSSLFFGSVMCAESKFPSYSTLCVWTVLTKYIHHDWLVSTWESHLVTEIVIPKVSEFMEST